MLHPPTSLLPSSTTRENWCKTDATNRAGGLYSREFTGIIPRWRHASFFHAEDDGEFAEFAEGFVVRRSSQQPGPIRA